MQTQQTQLLTAAQVMQMLQIKRTTLWRLMRRGVLKPVKLPIRDLRFRLDDVEKLVSQPNGVHNGKA